MLSFKTIRNVGLGSLCVLIFTITLLSLFLQQLTTKSIKEIVDMQEVKLNKWIELTNLIYQMANNFYINEKKLPINLDAVIALMHKADDKLSHIARYYPRNDFRIKKVVYASKQFKSVMAAYREELKEGYSGGSARELEKLVLIKLNDITGIVHMLAYEESLFLAVKNKNLIINIEVINSILLVIFIISVLIVLLVAVYLGKALTDPLKIISNAMERVSNGDLTYKINYPGTDIVAKLMNSFNHMVDDLDVAQNTLKKKNNVLVELNKELQGVQARLVQAEKMAAVGQLAGGVAHEINNPLTGVLNNVQLVKMIAQDKGEFSLDEFKDYLDVIEESALRCKKITESLLDFSHASLKQKQAVCLNELVEKVTLLISHEMKLQNIALQKELQPDIPRVEGDAQLLQQVIFNLISNAKYAIDEKFGKAGGVIRIITEYQENAKHVCLSVVDNGTGIPKDKLEKIFEPFFTTKPVGKGTGLGLSFIYSVVKEHKGNVNVESVENQGATFRIFLPAILEKKKA